MKQNKKTRVFIVDDHPVLRHGIKMLIDTEKSMEFSGESDEVGDAMKQINKLKPDIVIVDLSIDGQLSGFDLIKAIAHRYPRMGILVLSMHDEKAYAERSLKAGATGYIMKNKAHKYVINAINKIREGGIYLSEDMYESIVAKTLHGTADSANDPVETLSDREFEVFQMIANGLNTKEISSKMNLKISTIDSHKRHIREKLNLSTTQKLVIFASEWAKTHIK